MKVRLVSFLMVGLPALMPAAVDRSKPPEPGPPPEAAFPSYVTRDLANGLKVFVIEDDRKPEVTFRLVIKAGSMLDGDKPGLARFTAELLNRGTTRRDAGTFAREADSIGVFVEAGAAEDAISAGAGGLTKYTGAILDLLTDAVLHPLFAEEEFTKLQRRTLSRLEAEKQDPDALGGKMTGKVVYGEHPYAAYVTEESVAAMARQDVADFHSRWFVPNNATLAVVGDVQAQEILEQVENAFEAWKPGDVPQIKFPGVPALSGRSIHLVDRPGSVQSNVTVCRPGPARRDPNLPGLNVLNAVLGGGFSGRLFANLRETHGYTYGAYSNFGMNRHGGSFLAEAAVRNEVTVPAIREILAEIQRVRDELIPPGELDLQRQYLVGNYLLSLENPGRTAQRVQDVDLYGLDPDFYKVYAQRLASASAIKLQELAREHLSVEDLAIVVVGEAKEVKEELETLGPVTVYDTNLRVKTAE
ncbi:MAG TPA: pitrilysin family protein [Verrucomicrobiales bacterium]|nr:pitrilysin family protein [Verrucomicrobiales bacterium]